MNILTQTADGSNTLFNETIGEHYHSSHGALQESKHVFLEAGLKHSISQREEKEVNVLEVGFGTGLNFLLSFAHCEENNIQLNYTGIEAFPLSKEVIEKTGYEQYVMPEVWQKFLANYEVSLTQKQVLSSFCELEIAHITLANFKSLPQFDILYYDAFSVQHQPEMWTNEMIAHACSFLKVGGIFVSYAITGNLKRAVKSCGFTIEKLPGAAGKREMLRAIKS
ncbi:tRNA (5-methylaminomethyl-2-thiouridine)(34)-methyltransferase MnmD [Pedobacter sp. LMG 31464]|uniref:tRNA (5-methylaminomethyl-2-thiouridine)(34)-methyltransferase MnmD n=1 Tax=Pedobacter planticolens TaxID=2679964 RepID=A0A923IU36_9SPHI|nr:tRNA (5-methylaminomethyl-2-thiouridine)(34)-methyltransferase MnmD [Pedobacter planticolens]MBB2145470.1 tRNA (5-methylaminomethyl-2-thiouridine)(34)-methyltransferase MnmD [Pedobacter planticolens]